MTLAISGIGYRASVPGEGDVLHDSGRQVVRIIFDASGNVTSWQLLFSAGRHDNSPLVDALGLFPPAICALIQS
jgi:hypothetical protein